jgi:hypothetical protein
VTCLAEPFAHGRLSGRAERFADVWARNGHRAQVARAVGSGCGSHFTREPGRYGIPVASEEPEGIAIPSAWLGVEDVPILLANAFVSQFDPQSRDALTLTIGQVTFPAISGSTPEERAEQVQQIAYVPIKPIVRLGLTPRRARELIATLQANLDQLDEATKLIPGDPR